jgi:hypothetical protein
LQENQLRCPEFRQNEVPEFAAFTLKNREILDFSQPTKKLRFFGVPWVAPTAGDVGGIRR